MTGIFIMDEKKRITPHKGGRSQSFPGTRITPEAAKKLKALMERRNLSLGDWVEEKINEDYGYYLSQQEITILSKKAAEISAAPEVVTIDGKPWLNLGSGLLADAAIQMISVQFPAIECQRNGVDEWLVYEPVLAQDYYATLRLIMIFKVL